MRNEEKNAIHINLDGATVSDQLLEVMAIECERFDVAEHFLLAYYRQIVMEHGLGHHVELENRVRARYNKNAVHVPVSNDVDKRKSYYDKDREQNESARKKYQAMSKKERKSIIEESLIILIKEHRQLFTSKNHWIGLYLVVKDRVDGSMTKLDFTNGVLGINIDCWPDDLKISERTLSNFARCVDYEDRYEAYYDMESNPWEELCDVYWNILKGQILMNK